MRLKDSGRSWVGVGFWENPQILAKERGLIPEHVYLL